MIKDAKNIIVYHGSDVEVSKIDLKYANNDKDFGAGFYVTTDKKQAIVFAKLVARKNNKNKGYVSSFKLSNFDSLDVYEFKTTNQKWLDCFVGFRHKIYPNLIKEFKTKDVIIGKVADDNTSLVINTYLSGAYGKVGEKSSYEIAKNQLMPERLSNQLCFKTKKSINKLVFVESEVISNVK